MTSIKKIPNVLGTRRSNTLDQEREQFEKSQVILVGAVAERIWVWEGRIPRRLWAAQGKTALTVYVRTMKSTCTYSWFIKVALDMIKMLCSSSYIGHSGRKVLAVQVWCLGKCLT